MANNNSNHRQHSFWDFVQSFDPNGQQRAGAGVDHAATGPAPGAGFGFPFGGPGAFNPWAGGHGWEGPWGPPGGFGRRGGRHGRHGRRHGRHHHGANTPGSDEESGDSEEHDFDMEDSPETLRDDDEASRGPPGPPPHPSHGDAHMPTPPPPMGDHHHPPPPPPPHGGPRHGRHGRHGHGGPGGHGSFGGRGGCRGRGGPRGRHGHQGPPPPFPSYNGPFDFRPLMQALSGHPAAQVFREYFDRPQDRPAEHSGEQDSFVPPVDVFSTEKAYVLHVSLPGAVKEDVGVNWDADKSQLNIAGVIYRPGDEQFLQSLTSSERKIGMFERSIKLPPVDTDEKEEVDGFSITAKMENGVLIVTVPKAEKEWTEIHKVDIQ